MSPANSFSFFFYISGSLAAEIVYHHFAKKDV